MHVVRPPTAWLLLRPERAAAPPLVLPIHAAATLPDYVIPRAAFDRGCARGWRAGDRFRMQFGGRKGSWYRGTVASVEDRGSGDEWDPWEGLAVRWDDSQRSSVARVSLWEIDVDPNSDEVRCLWFLFCWGRCASASPWGGVAASGAALRCLCSAPSFRQTPVARGARRAVRDWHGPHLGRGADEVCIGGL